MTDDDPTADSVYRQIRSPAMSRTVSRTLANQTASAIGLSFSDLYSRTSSGRVSRTSMSKLPYPNTRIRWARTSQDSRYDNCLPPWDRLAMRDELSGRRSVSNCFLVRDTVAPLQLN
mgnify:CR=1 FL=1